MVHMQRQVGAALVGFPEFQAHGNDKHANRNPHRHMEILDVPDPVFPMLLVSLHTGGDVRGLATRMDDPLYGIPAKFRRLRTPCDQSRKMQDA